MDIDGVECETYVYGSEGPVIIWGLHPHDKAESLVHAIRDRCNDRDYTLLTFSIEDWNGQLSPWASEQLDKSFRGGGAQTLSWLETGLLPYVKEKFGDERQIYLMGYSLAGLFALWSLYQTEVFDGALSCSGSLWYPGFVEYAREHFFPKDKKVYLSLGGKESNTSDALMARVGENTREIWQLLRKDHQVIFEQNSGGHFADAGKRLAKAIRWITGI